jgi:hypothetical protein
VVPGRTKLLKNDKVLRKLAELKMGRPSRILAPVSCRRLLTGSSRAIGFIGATLTLKSGVKVPKVERLS